MTNPAPALFVGHGSPMNAIEDNADARGWRAIAERFAKPRAIVCVSAHWTTPGVRVTDNASPPTIHDFRGFPPELFAVRYPAPGAPQLAAEIAVALAAFKAETDGRWGLDHGAWSVLAHMYPQANVPVLQVSLDATRAPAEHVAIGAALSPLRREGVMILASGNIVHNLRAFFSGVPLDGAREFDDFIVERISNNDVSAVVDYARHPHAASAAPDWEHFFPVFYALGARFDGDAPVFFNRGGENGVAMTSFAYGLTP